jgi:hypothetical protein
LVNSVLEPEPGDFDRQRHDGLCFASKYLRRGLLTVRALGLAGMLTVHTHPFSDQTVSFSHYDDAMDPGLMANLYDLQPDGVFGSAVVGRRSLSARLWTADGTWTPLTEIVVVGEQVQTFPCGGSAEVASPPSAAIFDRALALTGIGALAKFAGMRVGVVGASGTGSLVIELLLRADVGEIVVFEFDKADPTNLNRVLHLRRVDADDRRPKADRMAEVVADTGLPTEMTIIPGGDIRNSDVADHLRSCDALFGCIDRDWPRLILCEIAYQYLIPYIDLGSEIGLAGDEVQSLDTRVSYITSGRPCLLCAGVVTQERIRLEACSDDELQRVVAMGYSRDVRLHSPAVMELNMRAAAQATLLFRHLLQPFLATPLPHSIHESLTNFSVRGVMHTKKLDCVVCGCPDRVGAGARFRLTTRR